MRSDNRDADTRDPVSKYASRLSAHVRIAVIFIVERKTGAGSKAMRVRLFLSLSVLMVVGCASTSREPSEKQFFFDPNAPVPAGEIREQADQIVHIFRPQNDFVEIKPYETYAIGTHLPFIVEQVRVIWVGANGQRHDVLFKVDSFEVGGRAHSRLAAFIRGKGKSIDSVLIEGRTDSTGSATYNMGLSERRADAVEAQLVSLGVSRERISTTYFGETHPIATNATAAGRQRNRSARVIVNP